MSAPKGSRGLERIFKEGKRFSTVYFTARWHPQVELDKPIIVVGQKTSKKATVRNRIRRRFRSLLKDFPQKGLVILGRLPAEKAPFRVLKNEVVRLQRRVGENGQRRHWSN